MIKIEIDCRHHKLTDEEKLKVLNMLYHNFIEFHYKNFIAEIETEIENHIFNVTEYCKTVSKYIIVNIYS